MNDKLLRVKTGWIAAANVCEVVSHVNAVWITLWKEKLKNWMQTPKGDLEWKQVYNMSLLHV